MVTKVNICDSLSDGAQTASSTSSGYASHPSSNNNTDPAKLDEERRSDGNLELGHSSAVSTLLVSDSAVPGPVWPDSKDSNKVWSDPSKDSKTWPDSKVGTHGSLPLRAGHVASQIQKLNIQLNQHEETARVVRNREFVTSISVESEGREEEVVTGNIESKAFDDPVHYQNLDFHRGKGRDGGTGRSKVAIQSNSELAGRGHPLPGLTGRAWPGNSLNYTEKANLTKVPGMLKTPDIASDRCFGIRHKAMSPIGEEQEKDTRMNDSIVTNSLLMMTSHSPAETMTDSDRQRGPSSSSTIEVEKEERVGKGPRLDYLTKAVISSQHASTLSRAMNQAKRSFRGSRRSSLRSSSSTSKRRSLGKRRERSRASAAKHAGGGAEAMRELWERTGMKTNGRKLLIESEDEDHGKTNAGYQSDGSEVSVPRVKGIRKLPGPGHRKTGSQSSTTSYDSMAPRGARPKLIRSVSGESGQSVGWEVRGGHRLNGLPVVDLDSVQMEGDSDGSTKHVRFSAKTRYSQFHNEDNSPLAKGGRQGQTDMWDRYYGTLDPSQLEAGFAPARSVRNSGQKKALPPGISSDLVMERITTGLLRRKERKRRGLRCFCKTFCFLLLLTSFLLVIVAVSIFLSRGRNYFGSLEV